MERGVVDLARQAAVAARAEREAAAEVLLPVRKYRGVRQRNGKFVAQIRIPAENNRRVWLGSYPTAEEAAHAYDAVAREVQGTKAKPNFPEPSALRAKGEEEDDVMAAAVFTHIAQVRRALEPAPLGFQQPMAPAAAFHWAPAPAAPAAAVPQPQAPHFHSAHAPQLPVYPYLRGPAQFSQFFYQTDPAAGATYGAAFQILPSMPGTYVAPEPDEPMPTSPASSALSSTDKSFDVSQSRTAAPERRGLPKPPTIESHQSVVGDNFMDVHG